VLKDRHNDDPVTDMVLVAFLRGINVGGHRTLSPSTLARGLSDLDVVNVGAAGTFIVGKPGSKAKFHAALLRKLPFKAEVVLCRGRDLLRLEKENPFGTEPSRPDIVRFVSILSRGGGIRVALPVHISARRGVVRASNRVEGPIRLWSVPSAHEDHRLSWPDR
jgi:Protein of unknown function (DUF1697)